MKTSAQRATMPASNPFVGPGAAIGSMISSQMGVALAVPLMLAHGSFTISALRLVFSALFCLAWVRPDVLHYDSRQWAGAAALGLAMAVMTMCFFTAAKLIPVGAAITIDFLGPLGLAVASLRGWPRVALPLIAAAGVLAVSFGGGQGRLLDPAGILFALAAGCGWACYIVLMRHVGQLFSAQEGLCLSLLAAAILAMPAAAILENPSDCLASLRTIASLALLSPLLPFVLEMAALRRMEIGIFSIVMSLEPAFGALFGFLILHQALSIGQIGGMLAVMAASAGAVLFSVRTGRATPGQ